MADLNITTTLKDMAGKRPLIHHITNWVTIYQCAQMTRSWGCLPIMAHDREEVSEMSGIASALVLNIGTLTTDLVDAMERAAGTARRKGIPVVLDAVGAGATKLRTSQARRLIDAGLVSVIKGNAGEIATLAGLNAEVRGVESISSEGTPAEIAKKLAGGRKAVVVISGKIDIVSDGRRTWALEYGHPVMGRVVGTGCASASTVGCFAATGGDLMEKCAQAMAAFGRAGEMAAEKTQGNAGRFFEALYDCAARLSADSGDLVLQAKEA